MAVRSLKFVGFAILITAYILNAFSPGWLAYEFIAGSFLFLPIAVDDLKLRRRVASALILIATIYLALVGYREVQRGVEPAMTATLFLFWLGMTLVLLSHVMAPKPSPQGSS